MSSGREPGLALLVEALHAKRTKHEKWPQWKALCPCHDDREPSLLIDYRVPSQHDPDLDDPKPMVHCKHPPCGVNLSAVCDAIGLPLGRVMAYNDEWDQEVMGEPPPPARLPFRAMLAAHCKRLLAMPERLAYLHDVRGLTTETIRRYCIGWDFRRYTVPVFQGDELVNLRRYLPGGEPKWVGLAGRSVKYLYPDFPTTTKVLLVEGELDALVARQHGLPAVTCIGGVNTWDPDWNPGFAGRLVVICFDCDDAGRSAAIARRQELCAAGARVKVVSLGLQDKEDLTDWFVPYNRTADELLSLIKATPATGNERPRLRRLTARTEGKKKAPAALQAPGLSGSPSGKEKTQQ